MLSRCSHQRGGCKCVQCRGLIKERNSKLPLFIGSTKTPVMAVSQRRLRNTYPVLSNALQTSGNRFINPVERISPRFTSIFDLQNAEEAMGLLASTLQPTSCQIPYCPDFSAGPVLEASWFRLRNAVASQDPAECQYELDQYIGLMNAFASLHSIQDPQSAGGFINSQLYQHRYQTDSGLGPRIDPLIRDMAVRFMSLVSQAGGVQAIFDHIQNHHQITGNDTTMVERLIAVLRLEEQAELYNLAVFNVLNDGDILSWKIAMLLEGQPVDALNDIAFVQWMRQMGI